MIMIFTFLISSSVMSQFSLSYSKSKKSKSDKRINIGNDRGSKLNLKSNQEVFKLEQTYPKRFSSLIKSSFTENFGNVNRNSFEWLDQDYESSIILKRNRVYIHMNK